MKKNIFIVLLVILFFVSKAQSSIMGSPHDVNVMRNTNEELQVCAMCHTPHSKIEITPLWNRNQPPQSYTIYESPSFDMEAEEVLQLPSSQCMTCHNGVSSNLVNYPGPGSNMDTSYDIINNDPLFSSYSNMGSNLKNNHPVSFIYAPTRDVDNNGFPESRKVGTSRKAIVGSRGVYPLYGPNDNHFECSTCHDVHDTVEYPGKEINDGKSSGRQIFFLRADNTGSRMCTDCHTNR